MKKKLVICVTGESAGAGKTSSILKFLGLSTNYLLYRKLVTVTTRSLRSGEKEAKDYYFRSEKIFQKMIKNDEFVEHNLLSAKEEKDKGNSNLYGLTRKELQNCWEQNLIPIHICDINGALKMKEIYGEDCLTVFIHAEFEELENRIVKRQQDVLEEIQTRLEIAIEESLEKEKCDYLILNEEGKQDETVAKLSEIVTAWVAQKEVAEFNV